MFEQLRRRDDTSLERRSDDDALSSTSLADRDVKTAMRATLDLSTWWLQLIHVNLGRIGQLPGLPAVTRNNCPIGPKSC